MIQVSIVGGSGYVGGELLRLLLGHPGVQLSQVTSGSRAGKLVRTAHPNLRGHSSASFVDPTQLAACDLLFLALPHGPVTRAFSGRLLQVVGGLREDTELDQAHHDQEQKGQHQNHFNDGCAPLTGVVGDPGPPHALRAHRD